MPTERTPDVPPTATTGSTSRRRSGAIGLLVEDVGNPFSAAIHRAVEEVARARSMLVLAASLDENAERERRVAGMLIERGVDGLVIVPCADDYDWIREHQRAGVAFVFADRAPQPLHADAVLSDHRAGTRQGIEHLLAGGHTRIAFLGDDLRIQTARDRYAGYCDVLTQAGLPIAPELVRTDLRTAAAAREATIDLLRTAAPTAIFAGQNLVLVGAIQALRRLDRQDRVALLGFDDLILADLLQPSVSVIAQQPDMIGHLAAQRLFARLDGDTAPPSARQVVTRLIPRGSAEITPRPGR